MHACNAFFIGGMASGAQGRDGGAVERLPLSAAAARLRAARHQRALGGIQPRFLQVGVIVVHDCPIWGLEREGKERWRKRG
jgi:hypothetical protein